MAAYTRSFYLFCVLLVPVQTYAAQVLFHASSPWTSENGAQSVSLETVLDTRPSSDVVVELSSLREDEGFVEPAWFVFTPQNWNIPQTAFVTGADDDITDGPQTFAIEALVTTSDRSFENGYVLAGEFINADNEPEALISDIPTLRNVPEGGPDFVFTLRLNQQPLSLVTLDISNTLPSEATVSPSHVEITPNNWMTPVFVHVQGVQDGLFDGNKSVRITTTGTTSEDERFNNMFFEPFRLSIIDTTKAQFVLNAPSPQQTEENEQPYVLGVSLAGQPSLPVNVEVVVSDPQEASVAGTSVLVFNPSEYKTVQQVLIQGLDDHVYDGDKNYEVYVRVLSGSDTRYQGLEQTLKFKSIDKIPPGIALSSQGNTTSEEGAFTTASLKLVSKPSSLVSVHVIASKPSEASVEPSVVSFNPSNWNVPVTLKITGLDDFIDDSDQNYVLKAQASSSDPGYEGLSVESSPMLNQDNDFSNVLVSSQHMVLEENNSVQTFRVTLSSQPVSSVALSLVSNIEDVSVAPSYGVMDASNWNTGILISVLSKDDFYVDGNRPFHIAVHVDAGSDATYELLEDVFVEGIQYDNDHAGFVVSDVQPSDVYEGHQTSFKIHLAAQPLFSVYWSLTESLQNQAEVFPQTGVFDAHNWNTPVWVQVRALDDHFVEQPMWYGLSLSSQSEEPSFHHMTTPHALQWRIVSDDVASFVVETPSGVLLEGSNSVFVKAHLTASPKENVVFNIQNSREDLVKIVPSSIVFEKNKWPQEAVIELQASEDDYADGTVPVHIHALSVSSDVDFNNQVYDADWDRYDNDKPFLYVSSTDIETNEEGDRAHVSVYLGSKPRKPVDVALESSDPSEGWVLQNHVRINPEEWNTPHRVDIQGQDDDEIDNTVSYRVLTHSLSEDVFYNGLQGDAVVLTNADNDKADVNIQWTQPAETSEDGDVFAFTAFLVSKPSSNVQITWAVSNTKEASLEVYQTLFTPINYKTPQTLYVKGVDDFKQDGNQTYAVFIQNIVSSDSHFAGLTASFEAVNKDNDHASVVVERVSYEENTSEKGSEVLYSVVLSSQPESDVTVSWGSDQEKEGAVVSADMVFAPATWNTPQFLRIQGQNDSIDDGDAHYQVLGTTHTQDLSYHAYSIPSLELINEDDDTYGVVVSPVLPQTTHEKGSVWEVGMVLSSQPLGEVRIQTSVSDDTEGAFEGESEIVFDASDWNKTHYVRIKGVDDFVDDGDVSYTVSFQTQSSDVLYASYTVPSYHVLNQDDDKAGVSIRVSSQRTHEYGSVAHMYVKLDSEPLGDVSLLFESSHVSEGTLSNQTLVFDKTQWNKEQRVDVYGVDDDVDDGDKTYTVSGVSSSYEDVLYQNIQHSLNFTNEDNDTASVVVRKDILQTSESGDNAVFYVSLTSQPVSAVEIVFTSSDLQEAMVYPSSVVFDAFSWKQEHRVTVMGVDDDEADGDKTYQVRMGYARTDVLYNAQNLPLQGLSFVNKDNDRSGVDVVAKTPLVTSEDGVAEVSFETHLYSKPLHDVWVHAYVSDIHEGRLQEERVLIPKERWKEHVVFHVYGVDDSFDDGDKSYEVVFSFESQDMAYNTPYAGEKTFTLVNQDDDVSNLVARPLGVFETQESGVTASLEVRLGAKPFGTVTVTMSTSHVLEGKIIQGTTLVFDASNYQQYQRVVVQGLDDEAVDGDVPYLVLASASSSDPRDNALLSFVNAWNMPCINKDNDVAAVHIRVSPDAFTTEEGAEAVLQVSLKTKPYSNVAVRFFSLNPKEGKVVSQDIVFTASSWNKEQRVVVKGEDDVYDDGDVVYQVKPSVLYGDKDYQTSMLIPLVSLKNINNDRAGIQVETTSLQTTESGGTLSVCVSLDTPPMGLLSIVLSTSDVSEGVVFGNNTLVFSENDWKTKKTVVIKGVDDFYVDGDKNYRVLLVPNTSDTVYARIIQNQGGLNLLNKDNDTAGLTYVLSSESSTFTDEKGKTISYDVVLKAQPMYPVTLSFSVQDVSEAKPVRSSIVFTSLNWNVAQKVVFAGVDDDVDDGDQRVGVTSTSTTQEPAFSSVGVDFNPSFYNVDDDESRLLVSTPNPVGAYTTEEGGQVVYQLTLSSKPLQNVVFQVVSSNTSEGVPSPSSVVFTALDWNKPHVVSMKGVDDDYDDGDVVYQMRIRLTAGDATYTPSSVVVADRTLVNKDNDTAGVVVMPPSDKTVRETGSSQTLSVRLLARPKQAVSVVWVSSDPSEGAFNISSVVFSDVSSQGWKQTKTILVKGVNDDVVDGDQRFDVRYSTTSQDMAFASFSGSVTDFVNLDDDVPSVKVSAPVPSYTDNTGSKAMFTVVLEKGCLSNVAINLSSSDTSLGVVDKNVLVFSPSNWNVPQQVTVSGVRNMWTPNDVEYVITTSNTLSASQPYHGIPVEDVVLSHVKRWQTSVAAGALHSCYATADKRIYCWGSHAFWQLGNDNTANHERRPMTVEMKNVWGTSWQDIAAGWKHTCALDNTGQIYCWGYGNVGELGYGSNGDGTMYSAMKVPRLPVAWPEGKKSWGWTDVGVGRAHTCAIGEDRTLWCFGRGDLGQRGDGSAEPRQGEPTKVRGGLLWKQISTGGADHTCGIAVSGELYCFGLNKFGALGSDPKTLARSYAPVKVGTDKDWVYVATGGLYEADEETSVLGSGVTSQNTCAIKRDGTLWCWGARVSSMLEGSKAGYVYKPAQVGTDTDWVRVEMSGAAAFAMKRNRTLWSWGFRNPALLGRTPNAQSPFDAPGKVTVGGGSALWSDYAVGAGHACALDASGRLYCFGSNKLGQLGLDKNETVTSGVVSIP
jgi:alpha-tubulin suppressor-like RCC1 family protein